ncbi:MAG: glutamine-hydrolyzing carbamoyl-phosphate synthase small subunit [bacterium]
MRGMLVLEDGSHFEGISIGAEGERVGEVVLNTAVVGYQEIMTDPANAGKLLVLTYPLIGNYGIAKKFFDSRRSWIEGVVIREESRIISNWQAEAPLSDFLTRESMVCLTEVDTRTIAVAVRDSGEMLGIVSSGNATPKELLGRLKERKKKRENSYIQEISIAGITESHRNPSGLKIGILDMGILNDFMEQLKRLGASITLIPYNADAYEIMSLDLDGLILSNGPEDDRAIPGIAETVKQLVGKIPLLGISLGHEIIGLALGGTRKRLKVGHHGVNYPVRSPDSYKGEITVQNHSWVLDEKSLNTKDDIAITRYNVNDNTIEEMECRKRAILGTQYYPVSPGFDEVNEVFVRFMEMIDTKAPDLRK